MERELPVPLGPALSMHENQLPSLLGDDDILSQSSLEASSICSGSVENRQNQPRLVPTTPPTKSSVSSQSINSGSQVKEKQGSCHSRKSSGGSAAGVSSIINSSASKKNNSSQKKGRERQKKGQSSPSPFAERSDNQTNSSVTKYLNSDDDDSGSAPTQATANSHSTGRRLSFHERGATPPPRSPDGSKSKSTPRRLLKRLFCTSQREKDHPFILSDIDSFTSLDEHLMASRRSRPGEFPKTVGSFPTAPHTLSEITGLSTSSSEEGMLPNHPELQIASYAARTSMERGNLLPSTPDSADGNSHASGEIDHQPSTSDESYNHANVRRELMNEEGAGDPTKVPLPASPAPSPGTKRVPLSAVTEILQVSSSGTEEELFLPHSSSSGSDLSPPPSPFPQEKHKNPSPSRANKRSGGVPKRNMSIQRKGPVNGMSMARAFMFPDVPTMSESPSTTPRGGRTPTKHRRDKSAAMDSVNEDDDAFLPNSLPDDSAFLPEDFDKNEVTYTWEQVQNHIQEAEERLRNELEEQHAEELQNVRDRAEYMLNDQATRLKTHAKEEAKRMDALLKAERNKAQVKHMELVDKVSAVSELKQEAERATDERGGLLTYIAKLQTRIQELEEANEDGESSVGMDEQQMKEVVQMYQKQVQTMQAEKASSQLQVKTLQEQLRESKEIMIAMEKQIEAFGMIREERSSRTDPVKEGDIEELQRKHHLEMYSLKSARDDALKKVQALSLQVQAMRAESKPSSKDDYNRVKRERDIAKDKTLELQEQLKTVRETELATLNSQLEAFTRLEAVAQNAKSNDPAVNDVSMLQEHLQVAKETVEVLRSKLKGYMISEETAGACANKGMEELSMMTLERDNLANELDKMSKKVKNYQRLQEQLQAAEETVAVLRAKLDTTEAVEEGDATKSKQSGVLENVIRERDQLRRDIETLRRDFRQHLQETKQQAASEIKELRRQIGLVSEGHDNDGTKNQTKMLVEERENFKTRLEFLHEQHAIELEQARIETEEEAEEQLDKFKEHVQAIYEEKDAQLEKVKASRDQMQEQVKQLLDNQKSQSEEAKQKGREELEPQLEALTRQLNAIRQESETELAEVLSKTRVERDVLQSQLTELKELHLEEVNAARKTAEKDLEMRFQTEGRDEERIRTGYEAELKDLITKYERQSADQQTEMKKMKKDYEDTIERIKSLARKEVDSLHEKLKETSDSFHNEREELSATLANDHCDMEAERQSIHKHYEVMIEKVRSESKLELDNEIKLLRAKLDMAHVKYEREKFEILESCEKECDDLRVKLAKMRESHKEQLAEAQNNDDSKNIIRDLQRQLQQIQDQYNSCEQEFANKAALERSQLENHMEEMRAKYQSDLESAQSKSKQSQELSAKATALEIKLRRVQEAQENELERARAEAKNEIEKELRELEQHVEAMQSSDNDLVRKIAELEASTRKDKTEYEKQVREVRADHGKEIEELLGQLDLVEQEHNERYSKVENALVEKEAVISALGKQLAEAQTRLSGMSENQNSVMKELEALQEEASQAQIELQRSQQEKERLQTAHERAIEKACIEAKEEMIARAEVQFEQANATYKKLKHEYDGARTRITILERDLKAAKRKVDEAKKAEETSKVDLEDELAQAKAAVATAEAQAARKARQSRQELEKSKESEKEAKIKMDEAVSSLRTLETTLAGVVGDRDRLAREMEEMKSVCEELMAMVEKQQQ